MTAAASPVLADILAKFKAAFGANAEASAAVDPVFDAWDRDQSDANAGALEFAEAAHAQSLDACFEAYDRLLAYPCASLADVQAKARIIYEAPDWLAEDLHEDRPRMLLRSLLGLTAEVAS